jgi:hypothetical protein
VIPESNPSSAHAPAPQIVPSAASHIVFHEVLIGRLWAEWTEISMHCASYVQHIEDTEQVVKRIGFTEKA